MKKLICLMLAGAVLILSLCGCNSGGAQLGCNPVPDKAMSTVGTSGSSVAPSSRDDSQILAIVKGLLGQQEVWCFADSMPTYGVSGFYATGYFFFDIDLDGNKELLVQLGGNDKLHCNTAAFKIDEKGTPSEMKKDANLSFSVEDLTAWEDKDGNKFYLNHYTMLTEKGSQEIWSKITFSKNQLSQSVLFHVDYLEEEVSSADTSSPSSQPSSAPQPADEGKYYIAGKQKAVSKDEFDKEFNAFRASLTQISVKSTFIKSTDWALYTDIQKENVLLSAYRAG